MAGDQIHAMSEMLAADPASLVFVPLAEALLARGDLARAMRVAARGAQRHPARIDAHDLVARIALASGDEARAEEAWAQVLAIDPEFGTAHRGLGLVRYRQGRLDEAYQHLAFAAHQDPSDASVRAALEAVQGVLAQRDARQSTAAPSIDALMEAASGPSAAPASAPAPAPAAAPAAAAAPDAIGETPAALFDPILDDAKLVALLLDQEGLVLAGQYLTAEGRDLGAEIGAHLTGVSDEAGRAARHFKLGAWTRLVIQTEAATLAIAPDGAESVLVAAPREVPLGFVRRTLDRALAVARRWLEGAR